MPSSLQVSMTPLRSMTSSHGEYSTSTKSILASFAARRSVSAEHYDTRRKDGTRSNESVSSSRERSKCASGEPPADSL